MNRAGAMRAGRFSMVLSRLRGLRIAMTAGEVRDRISRQIAGKEEHGQRGEKSQKHVVMEQPHGFATDKPGFIQVKARRRAVATGSSPRTSAGPFLANSWARRISIPLEAPVMGAAAGEFADRGCAGLRFFLSPRFFVEFALSRRRWNPPRDYEFRSRLRKRKALAMTETELRLIAAPAMIGLRRMPNHG